LVERVKTEVRTSSLLESEADAPGILKFGHKSFLEYIAAEEISNTILKPSDERSKALLRVTEASIRSILRQPEALDFFVELLLAHTGVSRVSANQLATASDAEQLTVGRRRLQVIIPEPRGRWVRRIYMFL
jgi:hypothetical protein